MKFSALVLFLLWLASVSGQAQAPNPYVTFESATVTAGYALPGSNAVVTASFKIKEGYYLHSSRPLLRQATPTFAQVGQNASARAYPVAYSFPAGKKTLPGVTQPVEVYEALLTVQVPVVVGPAAVFPIILPGVLTFVPMQDKTHAMADRLQRVNFSVTIPRSTNQPPVNAKSPATKAPATKAPAKK
jgi:hypothetical protein